MLGVIIGVYSVVTLVALGRGVQNYIQDQFDAIGSNLLFVSPGKSDFAGDPASSLTRNRLAEKHINMIKRLNSPSISGVTPYIVTGDNVTYKTKSYYSTVVGVSDNALDIFNYALQEGRNFTSVEQNNSAKVAIIGPLVKKELFLSNSPIDKKIKLGEESYTVIGVFEEKGSNYDDQVIIPSSSAKDTFDIKNYSNIVIKTTSPDEVDLVAKEVQIELLKDLDEDEFSILNSQDILNSIQNILAILTAGLGAIAGISLFVGGIGIMNIMLVSVTERTREIGLRKALGATSVNVAIQFMLEAVTLSVFGGLIGLFLGYLTSLAVQSFVRAEITPIAIILAFLFSVVVGVIFGTYPAVQASKKDPIEALRYE
ncbi:ABC transporter permease [Candidatus Nomurabacteria bacterium]|uniref:ABC transporter permease n=1 Tax=candidate division WWE3 bacterium TaxID=2053526 RepID=A0A955IW61_UNCKA|nr:ABC transporter permease [candidate division WWE3 bacterium]MCB9824029.1 ABC transporter permease [Candidatus Nomurabacteria bacterium]MCB9827970.1 ABC transporter permease [Candidatus Nomurabacteria bacterium]